MDSYLHPANAHKQRCPGCQPPLNTIVVHGQEQCVSLISSNAAQVIPVRLIITWLLDIREGNGAIIYTDTYELTANLDCNLSGLIGCPNLLVTSLDQRFLD